MTVNPEFEKKTRLKQLRVYAVGLVDSPAIKRRFLILKRNTPTEKVLAEGNYPLTQGPNAGGLAYCVCSDCGYSKKREGGEQCSEGKCPKCGGILVGSDTKQLNLQKEGGELNMSTAKDKIKGAIEQAASELLAEAGAGPVTKTTEKVEETDTEDEGKVLDAAIEKSAEGLEAQEKSTYTACMHTQLQAGKDFKKSATFCRAEVTKAETTEKTVEKEKEPEKIGEVVEKTKVKVSVDTGDADKEKEEDAGEVEKTKVPAGAFDKVFSAFDLHIGVSKLAETKRQWRAMKALVSKTVGSLGVQKSEPSFEDFSTSLDAIGTEIETVMKASPEVEKNSFTKLFSLLEKLVAGAEGDVKASYEKVKTALSKIVDGRFPATAKKSEDGGDVSTVEEMALLSVQLDELVKSVAGLKEGQVTLQAQLDKVPVPKGLVKKEEPRKQETVKEGQDSLLEKHKDEDAPVKLRSVISELEEAGKL